MIRAAEIHSDFFSGKSHPNVTPNFFPRIASPALSNDWPQDFVFPMQKLKISALLFSLIACVSPAFAQFTISTATTTPQTLSGAVTGTVTATGSITTNNNNSQ